MKRFFLIVAALIVAATASPASATSIRWEGTASTLSFDDTTLGHIGGYFDFDTETSKITYVGMKFTPLPGALNPVSGDPLPVFTANAVSAAGSNGAFFVDASDGPDFLGDYLIAVFAPSGFGQVGQTLTTASLRICAESDCSISRGQNMSDEDITFTSRALAVAVPEPVSGLLLATGLATLAAIRRRRNTA